jgi:putative membrane protein
VDGTDLRERELSAPDARRAAWWIGVLSALAIAVVAVVVYYPRAPHAVDPSPLPTLIAALNATSAGLLLFGWAAIRRRWVAGHRAAMLSAFGVSCLFLVVYLVHHGRAGSVPFGGPAWLRAPYLALLVPHIVLAALIVPLALTTIYLAWTGRFARHRRVARWTFPVWLYVSVSGVLVYLLLYHVGR